MQHHRLQSFSLFFLSFFDSQNESSDEMQRLSIECNYFPLKHFSFLFIIQFSSLRSDHSRNEMIDRLIGF